jgi:hypothetical protein
LTWIGNIPDYEAAINAAQKDAQLEKRLTGLAPNPITMEGEQERKSLGALVDIVAGGILARYVKLMTELDILRLKWNFMELQPRPRRFSYSVRCCKRNG